MRRRATMIRKCQGIIYLTQQKRVISEAGQADTLVITPEVIDALATSLSRQCDFLVPVSACEEAVSELLQVSARRSWEDRQYDSDTRIGDRKDSPARRQKRSPAF